MTHPPERPERPDEAWIDGMLDDLAKAPVADAPDALLARVMADAQAMLPAPGGAVARVPWWRQCVEAMGGWSAVGGVVAAAATGFVVGLGGLGGLDTVGFEGLMSMDYDSYYDSQDAVSAFGWDLEEG